MRGKKRLHRNPHFRLKNCTFRNILTFEQRRTFGAEVRRWWHVQVWTSVIARNSWVRPPVLIGRPDVSSSVSGGSARHLPRFGEVVLSRGKSERPCPVLKNSPTKCEEVAESTVFIDIKTEYKKTFRF